MVSPKDLPLVPSRPVLRDSQIFGGSTPGAVWFAHGPSFPLGSATDLFDIRLVMELSPFQGRSVGKITQNIYQIRVLDDGAPHVDARLADGTRLHAILAPLAAPGTCLSLRVPARRRFSLTDWVAAGSLPEDGRLLLDRLVRARVAFMVSGGTGTGKTTLLAALLACVPPQERLLIVEDSRELDPAHPHCIRLEARAANAEGAGRITLTDLVRQALRMRPDRIVLGEVRGAELCDLLMAMKRR